MPPPFHAASPDEIQGGRVSDAHLHRSVDVLRARGVNPHVVAEIRAPTFPRGWQWAVLAGLEEAMTLLDGLDVEVAALPEGSVFYPEEPVFVVAGRYLEYAALDMALVGMLAQASGSATVAARIRIAAEGRRLYAMGTRRLHPAVVPVVERAAYIGGCDAVATLKGTEITGAPAVAATGPELSLLLGEPEAWSAFAEAVDASAPVAVSVGATQDPRSAAVAAAEALGPRLASVRLEAPPNRRSEIPLLARDVRWELDARGYSRVRILLSGDLDEETIRACVRHVDAFGVGEALTSAPPVGFSFDLVEVDGRPASRVGTLSGRKTLWRCEQCGNRGIAPSRARPESCPRCGGVLRGVLVPLLRWGRREGPPPDPAAIRGRALREAAEAAKVFSRGG